MATDKEKREFGLVKSGKKKLPIPTGKPKVKSADKRWDLFYGSRKVVNNQTYGLCVAERNKMIANTHASFREFSIKEHIK